MNDKRKDEVFDGTPSHYLAVVAKPVNVYLNFKRLSRDDGTPLSAGEAKTLLAVRTNCIGSYAAATFSMHALSWGEQEFMRFGRRSGFYGSGFRV